MIVVIDNYDGFAYNVYQIVGCKENGVVVVDQNEATVDGIRQRMPKALIIAHGYANAQDRKRLYEIIDQMKDQCPILGIGLGFQVICDYYEQGIEWEKQVCHGKKKTIHIANGSPIFHGLPPIIEGAFYTSQMLPKAMIGESLYIIAEDEKDYVCGIKHKTDHVYGLLFHPESILTPQGEQIIHNFIGLEV